MLSEPMYINELSSLNINFFHTLQGILVSKKSYTYNFHKNLVEKINIHTYICFLSKSYNLFD